MFRVFCSCPCFERICGAVAAFKSQSNDDELNYTRCLSNTIRGWFPLKSSTKILCGTPFAGSSLPCEYFFFAWNETLFNWIIHAVWSNFCKIGSKYKQDFHVMMVWHGSQSGFFLDIICSIWIYFSLEGFFLIALIRYF